MSKIVNITSKVRHEVVALFKLHVDICEGIFAVVSKFYKIVVQAYTPNCKQYDDN